jgi:hypothetical protein
MRLCLDFVYPGAVLTAAFDIRCGEYPKATKPSLGSKTALFRFLHCRHGSSRIEICIPMAAIRNA